MSLKSSIWEHYSNSGVGRTQAPITEQTLDEFRDSLVLVVGLLAQRFGTPTGIYKSGTEEEFATAIRFREEQGKWPEIKWFFRETWDKQGPPKTPNQLMEASLQWQKVLDFKDSLQKSNSPFYTVDFPTTDDFPAIFRHDLERWLHDPARPWNAKNAIQSEQPLVSGINLKRRTSGPGLNCSRPSAPIRRWKYWMHQGMKQVDPIRLPDIFVLKTHPSTPTPIDTNLCVDWRDCELRHGYEPVLIDPG